MIINTSLNIEENKLINKILLKANSEIIHLQANVIRIHKTAISKLFKSIVEMIINIILIPKDNALHFNNSKKSNY